MPFKQIVLLIICLIDGFKFYSSKLFTHEKLDERVENNAAGIFIVGVLISPVLLVFLIRWILKKIGAQVEKCRANSVVSKVNRPQTTTYFNKPVSSNRQSIESSTVFYNVCKGLFGIGILGGIVVFIYAAFIYEPYDPLKNIYQNSLDIDDFSSDDSQSETGGGGSYNSVPVLNTQPASNYNHYNQYEDQAQEPDNSRMASMYMDNYERMANDVQSTYNSLMTLGSGYESKEGHNGVTDDFLGRSKHDLIFQMHQMQKEMRNLRYEAKREYGIDITQSPWETATVR